MPAGINASIHHQLLWVKVIVMIVMIMGAAVAEMAFILLEKPAVLWRMI